MKKIKKYVAPEIKMERIVFESPITAGSGATHDFAKGQNFYFDDWDDEEDLTLPKSKSLWEDD